jgi:hypothetical protein
MRMSGGREVGRSGDGESTGALWESLAGSWALAMLDGSTSAQPSARVRIA